MIKSGARPVPCLSGKGDETTLGVTPKLMEYWKRYSPQLFVTASHATQFNLEMPFGKGLIVSGNNRFYALDKKQFREFTTFLRGVLFNGKVNSIMSVRCILMWQNIFTMSVSCST